MALQLVVLKEEVAGERRVALVPEVVARLVKQGFAVAVVTDAGAAARIPDPAYAAAGASIVPSPEPSVVTPTVILGVQRPPEALCDRIADGSILIGFLAPHRDAALWRRLSERGVTACAVEKIPRVTRAQSMDALSSQATVVGYQAALLAAQLSGRFFPMLTTAAGTIRPARALIIGAGVAGLQAIATCRRLGAIVEAYDVRRAAKEQVESLGARFVAIASDAEGAGGYARELTDAETARQQELVARHVAEADVVITTAQIPGRPAPRIITAEMVAGMKSGAVIVDCSAEGGGNCACTAPGAVIDQGGITIAGPLNLPSELPFHASEMYAKNLANFVLLLTKNGASREPDWQDEILAGSVVARPGAALKEAS